MSVTESQLRQQYRNALEEELLLLAQRGPSDFTDTAWALLQEEITRRGLPPALLAQGLEGVEAPTAEKAPVVLSLGRWGEILDTGIPERFEEVSDEDLLVLAEHERALYSRISDELIRRGVRVPALRQSGSAEESDRVRDGLADEPRRPAERSVPAQQTYRLGWLFVCYSSLSAFATLGSGSPLFVAAGFAAAVAAAVRNPLAWYVVLVFTIAEGVRVVMRYAWSLPYLEGIEQVIKGAVYVSVDLAVYLLYFGYFYRRRAMFGAQTRLPTLEQMIPPVVGPEVRIRTKQAGEGAFGLSQMTTVLLGLILCVVLWIVFQAFRAAF